MRYRVAIDTSTTGQWKFYYKPLNGSDTLIATETQIVQSEKSEMWDFVTPQFTRKKNAGIIINNPMHQLRTTLSCGGGTYSFSNSGNNYHDGGDGSLTLHAETSWRPIYPWCDGSYLTKEETALAAAKLQCLSRIDKTPYAFLEDLFEIRQTFGTLAALTRSVGSFAELYAAARRAGKDPASAWLGVRFGIRPLVLSMIDLLNSLDRDWSRPPRQTARGRTSASEQVAGTVKAGLDTFSYNQSILGVCTAGCLYTVSNPALSIAWKYGLRAKDVPTGIWAVVPYSWVMDRFWDVSSCIQAFMNLSDPYIKILAAWSITDVTESKSRQVISEDPHSGWTGTCTGDVVNTTREEKVRVPWIPAYKDVVPPFHNGLDTDLANLLDLLTLVIQKFHR